MCPHYNSEALRRPTYHRLVSEGLPPGIAADDGVGLHFEGSRLVEIVSERTGAMAYRVEVHDGSVVERAMAPRLLKAPG